jgi:hypothetical protein
VCIVALIALLAVKITAEVRKILPYWLTLFLQLISQIVVLRDGNYRALKVVTLSTESLSRGMTTN